jgi:hypothetical protein
MSQNQTPEDDPSLRRLLHQWKVDAPLPPRFQEGVWQRIARAEAPPATSLWSSVARLVAIVLPRPKFALSYITLLLAVGVVAGSLAAQMRTRRMQTNLGLRYVQSIDPYLGHGSNR